VQQLQLAGKQKIDIISLWIQCDLLPFLNPQFNPLHRTAW